MANIMVNEACNLKCPYCFASEFVNKSPREMSLDEFRRALDFILRDGTEHQVSLIGGEPTLYSHINEALEIAVNDLRAMPVMIFTNAVALENISDELLESNKFRMLVNCNSPADMGQAQFDKMHKNLRDFVDNHIGEGRFRLSVNVYKPDFDFDYVIGLVREFGLTCVRMSVSVPAKAGLDFDSLSYFRSMKPKVMEFTGALLREGVVPGFDCNFMPLCLFSQEEFDSLMGVKNIFRNYLEHDDTFWERSIVSEIEACTPVIDILPDLTAVRCFGLSEYTKESIDKFSGIDELRRHYVATVDRKAVGVAGCKECESCYKNDIGRCSGGCYVFKAHKLFG